MSTNMPWFQSFLNFFLHHFVLADLATTSIRVKQVRVHVKTEMYIFFSDTLFCRDMNTTGLAEK